MIPMLLLAIATSTVAGPDPITSDWTGIYGVIDSAITEPPASGAQHAPNRIRLHGIFAVAVGPRSRTYHPARVGTLVFELAGDAQDAARRIEWRDLETCAGTGQMVAFSTRSEAMPTVWPLGTAVERADVYLLGSGVHKVERHDSGYEPVRSVASLPFPDAPEVKDGAVRISFANALYSGEGLLYRVELTLPDGTMIRSAALAEQASRTRWNVPVRLPDGDATLRVLAHRNGCEDAIAERRVTISGSIR